MERRRVVDRSAQAHGDRGAALATADEARRDGRIRLVDHDRLVVVVARAGDGQVVRVPAVAGDPAIRPDRRRHEVRRRVVAVAAHSLGRREDRRVRAGRIVRAVELERDRAARIGGGAAQVCDVMDGAVDRHVAGGGRADRRLELADDDVLVGVVARTTDRRVIRVAAIARDPPEGAGGRRRVIARRVVAVAVDSLRVREHDAAGAVRVVRAVQVEGDGAGRVEAAAQVRDVIDRLPDLDRRRGRRADRRLLLRDVEALGRQVRV